MEVYNYLGPGLLESIYEKAMIQELNCRGLNVKTQVPVDVFYKGTKIDADYRIDLLVENELIVELKSVTELIPAHRAQLFNYLRLTKKPMGILFNFGEESLRTERYAFDSATNECVLVDVNMKPLKKNTYLH